MSGCRSLKVKDEVEAVQVGAVDVVVVAGEIVSRVEKTRCLTEYAAAIDGSAAGVSLWGVLSPTVMGLPIEWRQLNRTALTAR